MCDSEVIYLKFVGMDSWKIQGRTAGDCGRYSQISGGRVLNFASEPQPKLCE